MTTDSSLVPGAAPSSTPVDAEAQTRQRLLEAAIAVFDRKGYAGASVREIVERARVTKPALYYYFGSKEGLMSAVLREGERRFSEALTRAVERRGSTRERILALGDDLYRLFGDNRAAVRIAHALFLGPAEAAPAFDFTTFDRALVRTLQTIVEDGMAAGDLAPARAVDVALALTGVIGACAARQLHPGLEQVAPDSMPRILGLVLDGVLQPPQGERRP